MCPYFNFTPRRRRDPELLDLPEEQADTAEFCKGLEEIAASNRHLGGTKAVLAHLHRFAPAPGETLSVLDIATGSADIPLEIVEWTRKRGVRAKVTAMDINPKVVEAAKARAGDCPEIDLLVADGMEPPFRDKCFDIAVCALTVHHFGEHETERLLMSLKKLARKGVIVSDLRRSWIPYALFFCSLGLTRRTGSRGTTARSQYSARTPRPSFSQSPGGRGFTARAW